MAKPPMILRGTRSIRVTLPRVPIKSEIIDGQLVLSFSNGDIQIVGVVPVINPGQPTPTPTPTPTPAPIFTTQPTISPTSGTAGSTVFTANNGLASNATSYTRRWLLGATAIGSGATVAPSAAGSLTLELTAIGPGGTAKATSAAVTVAAAPATTPGAIRPLTEGDSWDTDYPGYFVGAYMQARPQYPYVNLAKGGQGLNDLVAREAEVIAANPTHMHTGIGRNDLYQTNVYPTAQDYVTAVLAHLARIKAQIPGIVQVVETLCAERVVGTAQQPYPQSVNTEYNARRLIYNEAMRNEVRAGRLAAVVDFAASTEIGTDDAMIPAPIGPYCISNDGLHLYDRSSGGRSGHDIAFEIFTATMDAVLTGAPSLTIARSSTAGAKPFTWRLVDSSLLSAGDFWNVQRATSTANLTAGVLNGQATQQITQSDLVGGDVVFPDLTATPSGPLALRVRVGREDGQGGYVWSDWSNILTDTIS